MRVLDYSWSRPSMATLRAQGAPGDPVVGVIRYVSSSAGKNLTAGERDTLHAADFLIGLVWEDSASAALGGANRGAADARKANSQADALGFPAGRPIYYAVDFDVTSGQLSAVVDYFRGARQGGRPAGVYGQASVLDACAAAGVCDYFWQTVAWSHGARSPHRHLLQNQFLGDIDINEVTPGVIDWGQDRYTAPPSPDVPTPGERILLMS